MSAVGLTYGGRGFEPLQLRMRISAIYSPRFVVDPFGVCVETLLVTVLVAEEITLSDEENSDLDCVWAEVRNEQEELN